MERCTIGLLLLLLAVVVGACTSPESQRSRGGGPGADVRNRRAVVQMHEGARPFYKTPELVRGAGPAPIAEARQADRLSRGESPSASPR